MRADSLAWLAAVGAMAALSLAASGAGDFSASPPARSAFGEMPAEQTPLAALAAARPFPEYRTWWPLGERFSTFMSEAIVTEWAALPGNSGDLEPVRRAAEEYLETVYQRTARPSLVDQFVRRQWTPPLQSGEFDALSFAFFRSAFALLASGRAGTGEALEVARRRFAERVGRRFFERLAEFLQLSLPSGLQDEASFRQLKDAIDRLVEFLREQGYFRTHGAFRFAVRAKRERGFIDQSEDAFLDNLRRRGVAYGLYEMGYPVILPSAVYLFELDGEAQHHSSRTIQELFDRVGCDAREVPDFDPRGYPADLVVELWEIRRR